MLVLACALLLLQLSTVTSFPEIAFKKRLLQRRAVGYARGSQIHSQIHGKQPAPRSSLLSNRVHALQDKKTLDLACWDGSYYINTTIGTPPQKFELSVLLDTDTFMGDSTWVPSKQCGQKACETHQRYDSSASKTYTPDGQDFYHLLTGAEGFVSNDTLCLGNVCVEQSAFGEVTDEGLWGQLGQPPFDGFIDVDPNHSLMHSMLTEQMKEKVISIWATENGFLEKNMCGKLILGGVDDQLYSGAISWVPLDSYGYQFPFESATIGNISLGCNDDCTATVSIGFYPLMMGPAPSVKKIHDIIGAVEGKFGIYSVDCEKVPNFPPIAFTIAGKTFSLNGADYTYEVEEGICWTLFAEFTDDNDWVFSSSLLTKAYMAVDVERNMIGFADAKHL